MEHYTIDFETADNLVIDVLKSDLKEQNDCIRNGIDVEYAVLLKNAIKTVLAHHMVRTEFDAFISELDANEVSGALPKAHVNPVFDSNDLSEMGSAKNFWIYDLLKRNTIQVVFIKSDGSTRTMRCTLNSRWIPAGRATGSNTAGTSDVISVWDLDKNEWRSFNTNRLISVRVID